MAEANWPNGSLTTFDFSRLHVEMLTDAHGDLQLLTIGLVLLGAWQVENPGCMVGLWAYATQNHVRKENIE